MTEFKNGDLVLVKPGASSRYGWVPKDDTTPLPVVRIEHDYRVFVRSPWDHIEYGFPPDGLTPAPLDPSGRHELAADFFHAKTGTAASYFTVDLSPEERAPYYAAADAFLAAHLTPEPEPEPEWAPGTVADIEVGGDMQYRAIRTDDHLWSTESHWSYEDAEVTDVRPLVVLDPESDTDRLAAIISSHRHGSEVPWPEDRRTAEAILERLSR